MSSSVPIIQPPNAGQLTSRAARYKRASRCAPSPYFLLLGFPSRLRNRPRTFCATTLPNPRSVGSVAGGAGEAEGTRSTSAVFGDVTRQAPEAVDVLGKIRPSAGARLLSRTAAPRPGPPVPLGVPGC